MTPRGQLIATFRTFPKELFRNNRNGPGVKLRSKAPGKRIYDINIEYGRVIPKALNPPTYTAPNGASMRPNSPYQHIHVRRHAEGDDVVIYAIPKGTDLPDDLILVHERSDHYSLQAAKEMTLEELEEKMTKFMKEHGKIFTTSTWKKAYPRATEPWPKE